MDTLGNNKVTVPRDKRKFTFNRKVLLAIAIALLIIAGLIVHALQNKNPSKKTTTNSSKSVRKHTTQVAKDTGKDYCIDGTKTVHTPVNNFYGQGVVLITPYADQLVKEGGFYTNKDGTFANLPSNTSGLTKHSIKSGSCGV